jgi:hypothetical protein
MTQLEYNSMELKTTLYYNLLFSSNNRFNVIIST